MSVRLASAVLLAWCLSAAPARAEIYRWMDSAGRERFSNRLADVPAAQRDEAARRASSSKSRVSTVESAEPPAAAQTPARSAAPAARDAGTGGEKIEKIGGDDEAGWRTRAAKLRSEIERLEGAVEDCKGSAAVRWNPGAGRRAYDREAAEADACQGSASSLQYARIQLEKLVENARKLGVPPGWVR